MSQEDMHVDPPNNAENADYLISGLGKTRPS